MFNICYFVSWSVLFCAPKETYDREQLGSVILKYKAGAGISFCLAHQVTIMSSIIFSFYAVFYALILWYLKYLNLLNELLC